MSQKSPAYFIAPVQYGDGKAVVEHVRVDAELAVRTDWCQIFNVTHSWGQVNKEWVNGRANWLNPSNWFLLDNISFIYIHDDFDWKDNFTGG